MLLKFARYMFVVGNVVIYVASMIYSFTLLRPDEYVDEYSPAIIVYLIPTVIPLCAYVRYAKSLKASLWGGGAILLSGAIGPAVVASTRFFPATTVSNSLTVYLILAFDERRACRGEDDREGGDTEIPGREAIIRKENKWASTGMLFLSGYLAAFPYMLVFFYLPVLVGFLIAIRLASGGKGPLLGAAVYAVIAAVLGAMVLAGSIGELHGFRVAHDFPWALWWLVFALWQLGFALVAIIGVLKAWRATSGGNYVGWVYWPSSNRSAESVASHVRGGARGGW